MKVGHALAPKTQMRPVVTVEQLAENMAYADIAAAVGAELGCGGARFTMEPDGHYMSPRVFLGTCNDIWINREEMFAPLTSVIKVDGYDEALATVYDATFGLTSGIVTKSLARAGIFYGFQNLSPIEYDVGSVETLYALGVRFMYLSYNNQSLLATGFYEAEDRGLTRMGRQVIKEMNRVGMVVDMSHSADRSTIEAGPRAKGFSSAEIDGLMGGNWYRFLQGNVTLQGV